MNFKNNIEALFTAQLFLNFLTCFQQYFIVWVFKVSTFQTGFFIAPRMRYCLIYLQCPGLQYSVQCCRQCGSCFCSSSLRCCHSYGLFSQLGFSIYVLPEHLLIHFFPHSFFLLLTSFMTYLCCTLHLTLETQLCSQDSSCGICG